MLLPVYAERVAEPADADAGTGCWVVAAYSVNAARPGGGVYREWWEWCEEVGCVLAKRRRHDDGPLLPERSKQDEPGHPLRRVVRR